VLEEIRQIVLAHDQHGQRTYSMWNKDAFLSIVATTTTKLCARLSSGSSSHSLVAAYIRLVEEGLGLGRLTPIASGTSGRIETLLWHSLIALAPDSIPNLPEPVRMQTLADIWNLCESVAELPAWAYTYISGRACDCLTDIRTLKEFIERESSILFSNSRIARWTNGTSCTVLNVRSLDPIFLPGDVTLLTANVAAVKDRRAPTVIVLVFREHAEPHPIGPLSSRDLVTYADPTPPRVVPIDNGIKVGNTKVELPFITDLQSYVSSSAGFCVCTACDSQWLWLVRAS
jgi:hypothetical protein